MSLDLTAPAAYSQKQDEIAQVLQSRKRKLIELYTVATSAEAFPSFRLALDGHHPPDLALFLQQNDIEQGRYFQDATVPPRHTFNAKLTTTRHASTLPTTSFSQKRSPKPRTLDAISPPVSLRDANITEDARPTANGGSLDSTFAAQNQISTPHDHVRSVTLDADRPTTVLRNSGVVVDETRLRLGQRSPRLTLQAESFSSRNAIVNPSRPVSPPYSPGTEPSRTGTLPANDDVATAASDGPSNVLTPRRDNQDVVDSNRKSSDHEMFDTVEDLSEVSHPGRINLKEHLAHVPNIHVSSTDIAPASPSDTSHSAHTARTTAQSPVTTPEENVSPPRVDAPTLPAGAEVLPPLQGKQAPEALHIAKLQPTDIHKEQGVPPALAVESTRFDPRPAFPDASHDASQARAKCDADKAVDAIANKAPAGPISDGAVSTDVTGTAPVIVSLQTNVSPVNEKLSDLPRHQKDAAATLPMDIDQPETALGSLPSRLASRVSNDRIQKRGRVQKSRSTRGVRNTHFVLSQPSEDRYIETMRNLRKEYAFKQSTSLSYLKPLVQHQVYNAENLKPVENLLMGTSKTINTSDFMASIREEQDLRVLERTRNLQLNLRWSLRQPKPSVEPPQPRSHWDAVLSNVKWLRTDFKEEAKLRTAVAKNLAEWCAAWVAADPVHRSKMQIKIRSNLNHTVGHNDTTAQDHSTTDSTGEDIWKYDKWLSNDDGINYFTITPGDVPCSLKRLRLGEELLSKIPVYKPGQFTTPIVEASLQTKVEPADSEEVVIRLPDKRSTGEQAKNIDVQDRADDGREPSLPPENDSCALFHAESRPLRARLTAPWVFKPPTAPMPPQAFYEHRSASQWNWEDDQLLKQYTKDFPSNWPLIADRMAPKTTFSSYVERRTPWECYERLLAMEGPPNDAQARQYLRHFSYRLERARELFDKHQNTMREVAEQHAQNAGQPMPVVPQKRFPTPMRVERKPNKRLIALLDGARKLARKREQSAAKQQNQSQQEGQLQKAAPGRMQQNQTPQYFSRMKYEAEVKEQERLQSLRDQQRAMLEAQRRQQGGQQAHLTNGIGQQMRNRVSNGQANSTQVPVPTGNPAQARQLPQQLTAPMGLPNGASSNAQLALNGRPQANMLAQQRIAPHINGQAAPSSDTMRMVQQMQAQRAYQMGQPQPTMQNQFGRVSPNVAGANGIPSANMLAAFNNVNNYPMALHDGVGNPSLSHQVPNGTPSRSSPHIAQVPNFQQTPTQPQQLSSGHVTAIVNLEHQIRSQNPAMSANEVRHLATMQLKHMTSMSRQNAINAATGAHPPAHPIMRGGGGPQSPFPLAPQQQAVSTPQMSQQALPQQPQQQHSPYQQNGMLSTPSNYSARGHSPVNMPANLASSPQLQAQQPQSQYSAQLRQAMVAQQQRQHPQQLQLPMGMTASNIAMGNSSGSPPAPHGSPAMAMAMPAFAGSMNRTPSSQSVGNGMLGQSTQGQVQSMRPPSRSASSMGIDGQFPQPQAQQQRPMPSPRPLSSQGFGSQ